MSTKLGYLAEAEYASDILKGKFIPDPGIKKIQSLFKILQIAYPDVCFSHYKMVIQEDNEGNNTPILDTLVVEDHDDIPESITGMSKFFWCYNHIKRR